MSEQGVFSSETKTNEKHLFVAVRSMDRRTLISPSKLAPDFFNFHVEPQPISLEKRAANLMFDTHGVVVNSDHQLHAPSGEDSVIARATYLRHIAVPERAEAHGHFDVAEVEGAHHDFTSWSNNESEFTEEERRLFRIKAHLFRQVLFLFDGKNPYGGARRR